MNHRRECNSRCPPQRILLLQLMITRLLMCIHAHKKICSSHKEAPVSEGHKSSDYRQPLSKRNDNLPSTPTTNTRPRHSSKRSTRVLVSQFQRLANTTPRWKEQALNIQKAWNKVMNKSRISSINRSSVSTLFNSPNSTKNLIWRRWSRESVRKGQNHNNKLLYNLARATCISRIAISWWPITTAHNN